VNVALCGATAVRVFPFFGEYFEINALREHIANLHLVHSPEWSERPPGALKLVNASNSRISRAGPAAITVRNRCAAASVTWQPRPAYQ
jgi:hypothetical protein